MWVSVCVCEGVSECPYVWMSVCVWLPEQGQGLRDEVLFVSVWVLVCLSVGCLRVYGSLCGSVSASVSLSVCFYVVCLCSNGCLSVVRLYASLDVCDVLLGHIEALSHHPSVHMPAQLTLTQPCCLSSGGGSRACCFTCTHRHSQPTQR